VQALKGKQNMLRGLNEFTIKQLGELKTYIILGLTRLP
jgi:hypothetical protein